jgi:arabinofuranan 3-O-arabinosyltransferase
VTRWLRRNGDVAVLLVLAYLPTLTASVGRVPADTKLFLFLDPARLMSEAPLTWDPQQFAGWVPHQTILYLWPSGPWFWFWETVAMPDWLAQRLWVGTLLFAAGMGVRFLARTLGFTPLAAAVAAVVYQLSPYVLPYISRTSVMLLPWAGLGWIVAYTVRAATTGRWRPALAASLVVLTVAPVNATATAMIAPAPVLWLIVASWQGRVSWRRAVQTAGRIGVVSLGLSLWWIVKLAQQGRYGAAVLSYSETLEAVSATSTSTEVMRGLGYWLFYVRDPYIATTTAAEPHLTSGRVVLASFLLIVIGLVGLVVVRWGARAYAAALVAVGMVLAIGAHPVDDLAPLQSIVYGDLRSGLSLALRSSSRAAPLIVLGLALGTGALVGALRARERRAASPHRWSLAGALTIVLLAVVNLPALRTGGYVDDALLRDQDPPAEWIDATNRLDAEPDGGRVMQLPGQESATFRWGYTVDPPLAGLTDRPIITRDWLPLGEPTAMDLFYALDDRIQSGALEPSALAPVARLLGVDTVWLTGDVAFDRFRTARPEPLRDLFLEGIEGVGAPVDIGEPVVNTPAVPTLDETELSDPSIGSPLPRVSLVPIEGAEPLLRAKTETMVLAGSGDGIVDAAAAGLIDGTELIRYVASLADSDRVTALAVADLVVLTDSNRARAHHWRGSQDVVGFTEDGSGTDVIVDIADQRLPVFDPGSSLDQTVAEQIGPMRATASGYGAPLWYTPEDRAVMAIDDDLTTAWTVADRGDPIGASILVESESPIESLRLVQPLAADANRWITRLDLESGDGAVLRTVDLGPESRTADGQKFELDDPLTAVRLVVRGVEVVDRPSFTGVDAVGFAEIDSGQGATTEFVRLPVVEGIDAATPVAVVLTRHRVSPTDRWRSDPEPVIRRVFDLEHDREMVASVTVRLDRRASDGVLADLWDVELPTADTRLLGSPGAAAWAALDGDPETRWTSAFGGSVGATIVLPDVPAGTDRIVVTQPADPRLSRITALDVRTADGVQRLELSDPLGRSVLRITPTSGPIRLTVASVDARTTVDRRTFDVVETPVAISEIEVAGLAPVGLPGRLDTGCRDDLVSIDGSPLPIRIDAPTDDLVTGRAVTAVVCGEGIVTLSAGPVTVETSAGHGLQVDQIVLQPTEGRPQALADERPSVVEVSRDRTSRVAEVAPCPAGCWFVQAEGANPGWTATVDGEELGAPEVVDGGMSGWWLSPSDSSREVRTSWGPQRRVDIAIVLSALLALVVVVLVLRDRRRSPTPVRDDMVLVTRGRSIDRRAGAAWAVGAGIASWLVLGVWVGAVVLVASVGALVVLRRPHVLGALGLAAVAVVSLIVTLRVRNDSIPPDFRFPAAFEDLHRPMAAAVVAVVLAVLADTRRRA